LEELPFQRGTFDFITCNMVIEHLSGPAKVFTELFRVLRPGGVVIILTPNIYHWTTVVSMLTPFWFHRKLLKRLWNRAPEDVFPTLYRCNARKKLEGSLRSAGFVAPVVHMIPGRQRLIESGLLFYLEYAWRRLSLRYEELRESLCAVAQESPTVVCVEVDPHISGELNA
jgi:SAM-dependent methyltransferase